MNSSIELLRYRLDYAVSETCCCEGRVGSESVDLKVNVTAKLIPFTTSQRKTNEAQKRISYTKRSSRC
jgi:hypothetical protein